jgi:hypothetical protein
MKTFLPFRFILFLIVFGPSLWAQTRQIHDFYGKEIATDICRRLSSYGNDEKVDILVAQIVEKYGAKSRYLVKPCDQIPNAAAVADEQGVAYILYNPTFLAKVKALNFTTGTPMAEKQDWATLTLLAHEIGHHINLHMTQPDKRLTEFDFELEADETAGFLMYKLGASLAEAQMVMHSDLVSEDGSMTHPPRKMRLEAIKKGWDKAAAQSPAPVNPTPVKPEPVKPTPVNPAPVKPEPVRPTPVDPVPVNPKPVNPTPEPPCFLSNLPGVLGLTGATGVGGAILVVGIGKYNNANRWYEDTYGTNPIGTASDFEGYKKDYEMNSKLFMGAGAIVFATGAAVFLNKIIKVSNHNRGCPGAMSARHPVPSRLHFKPVLSTQGNVPGIGISMGF